MSVGSESSGALSRELGEAMGVSSSEGVASREVTSGGVGRALVPYARDRGEEQGSESSGGEEDLALASMRDEARDTEREEWVFEANSVPSTVAGSNLLRMRVKYRIPMDFNMRAPEGGERACDVLSSRQPFELCLYEHQLKAGLRLSLHPFLYLILRYFGIALSQLVPNSVRLILAFIIVCQEVGVMTINVFKTHFQLAWLGHSSWVIVSSRQGKSVLKEKPSSIKGWKGGFFFVQSAESFDIPLTWGLERVGKCKRPHLSPREKETLGAMLAAPLEIDVLGDNEKLHRRGLCPPRLLSSLFHDSRWLVDL